MFIGNKTDQLPFSSILSSFNSNFSIDPSTFLLNASILPELVITSFILPISLEGLQFLFNESFSSSLKTLPIKTDVGVILTFGSISYLLIPKALPVLKLSHQ